jgi:hypothetical protein
MLLNFKYGRHAGHDAVDSQLLRRRALDALESSTKVTTSFVSRDSFYSGLKDKNLAREQYFSNMLDSDYVLCVRGSGNYSFRFFDALSMGRVPAVVDTDCVLPFDFAIDFASFLPFVRATELRTLPEVIRSHYDSLNAEEWALFQHSLRCLYLEAFAPKGFFSRLALHPEIAGWMTDCLYASEPVAGK